MARTDVARAAAGTLAVAGSATAFVLGGPVNLLGALLLTAMFYPAASSVLTAED